MKLDQGRYGTDCDMPLDLSVHTVTYIYLMDKEQMKEDWGEMEVGADCGQ